MTTPSAPKTPKLATELRQWAKAEPEAITIDYQQAKVVLHNPVGGTLTLNIEDCGSHNDFIRDYVKAWARQHRWDIVVTKAGISVAGKTEGKPKAGPDTWALLRAYLEALKDSEVQG